MKLNTILFGNIKETMINDKNYTEDSFKLNPYEDVWGADDFKRHNEILKKAAEFAPREDNLYYVFAYGTISYLVGVADNLFTAKLMELYKSFSNAGWMGYGDFYSSNVLVVPKSEKFKFSFKYIYDNFIDWGSRHKDFYTNLDIHGTKILTLSTGSFEEFYIPEDLFTKLKPYKDEDGDCEEWNLGGIFSDREMAFIKRYILPLYRDKFGNSIVKWVE